MTIDKAESKKSAEIKMNVFTGVFTKYYKQWDAEGVKDDRRVFCNMYEILKEALQASAEVTNNTIWVAFNEYFRKEERIMCEIVKRFTGSFPVYGSHEYYPEG